MTNRKPILCLDSHELAWAAGFFDGEGYVGARQRGERWEHPGLTIAQIAKEPLDRFRLAVGGIGNITGPYRPKNPNGQPYYQYSLHGFVPVQAVTAMLWRWLCSVKRAQCATALTGTRDYLRSRFESGGKGVSKLTLAQAAQMRIEHATAQQGRQRVPRGFMPILAARYGIKQETCANICQGYGYNGSRRK